MKRRVLRDCRFIQSQNNLDYGCDLLFYSIWRLVRSLDSADNRNSWSFYDMLSRYWKMLRFGGRLGERLRGGE
jgi:hypothetical protein